MFRPMTAPRPLTPFEGMDIRSLIDARAAWRGDHPFLVWEPFEGEGRTWSYGQFRDAVRGWRRGCRRAGSGSATGCWCIWRTVRSR